MRLYITGPSPFARKCRIAAREKGLSGRVQEVLVDPFANDPLLVAVAPLAQVPALATDDDEIFTDSSVICAFLDEIGEGPRLTPASGPDHWRVRRLETLADGALEMGVKMILELRRPEPERSAAWIARWRAGLERTLDQLERDIPAEAALNLGTLTAAVALTWLDFRHPSIDWRGGRSRLAALQAELEARDSFKATVPA